MGDGVRGWWRTIPGGGQDNDSGVLGATTLAVEARSARHRAASCRRCNSSSAAVARAVAVAVAASAASARAVACPTSAHADKAQLFASVVAACAVAVAASAAKALASAAAT
jgi:hypothetical protein